MDEMQVLTPNSEHEITREPSLLHPPSSHGHFKGSTASLTASEFDHNGIDTRHFKKAVSTSSIDENAELVPDELGKSHSATTAMIEISCCYDREKSFLNLGVAYAYYPSKENLKNFSEAYVRLVVTPIMPPQMQHSAQSKPQYRTTKVVKAGEVMEILQKFRFDLPKSWGKQDPELAIVNFEVNAYGRTKSHTIIGKSTIFGTNLEPVMMTFLFAFRQKGIEAKNGRLDQWGASGDAGSPLTPIGETSHGPRTALYW